MFLFVSEQANVDNSFFAFKTLSQVNNNMPSLVATLSLSSLLGLPPFMGFFTKLFILITVNNLVSFYLLVPILLVLLTLMLFYVKNLSYTFDLTALHRDSLKNQRNLVLPKPHSM